MIGTGVGGFSMTVPDVLGADRELHGQSEGVYQDPGVDLAVVEPGFVLRLLEATSRGATGFR